jgi:hypothetical protein
VIVNNSLVPPAEPFGQVLVPELRTKINVSLNMFRELLKDRVEYLVYRIRRKDEYQRRKEISSGVDIVHHEEQ